MKKLITSFITIMIISIIAIIPKVKAADEVTANITFSGSTTTDTVVLNINAGAFEGLEPGGVVNASLTLDYNSDIVSSIEVESYQDWKIEIVNETKRVLISTDKAKDNIQIAKIIFHLDTSKLKNESQTFSIKDFEIASGGELNETYPQYDYTFTPQVSEPSEENKVNNNATNESGTAGTNTNTQNTNRINSIKGNKTDSTVAKTKLPAAGMGSIILIIIVCITILSIVFKIKSRKIKY